MVSFNQNSGPSSASNILLKLLYDFLHLPIILVNKSSGSGLTTSFTTSITSATGLIGSAMSAILLIGSVLSTILLIGSALSAILLIGAAMPAADFIKLSLLT